jgi:DNA-directed RNA polymerase subunit RPC12/RpoP
MAAQIEYPCPRCGRMLLQEGERIINDIGVRAFQCDDCIVNVPFNGAILPLAFYFCVDDNGKAFDPDAPEGKLPD